MYAHKLPTTAMPASPGTPSIEVDGKLHIPELDGLRGIAILFVLIFHFNPLDGLSTVRGSSAPLRVLNIALGAEWVGVDLFFVLSGFLITGILLRNSNSPHRFRNFYGRRALRIFPLYYGVLLVYFLVAPLFLHVIYGGDTLVGRSQLWYWLYSSNLAVPLGQDATQAALGHFWSLAVEEQFYLIWPCIVFFLGPRWLPAVALTALALAAISKWWCIVHHVDNYATYEFSPCRAETLAVGSVLAASLSTNRRQGMSKLFKKLFALAASALVAIACFRHGFWGWDRIVQLVGLPILAVLFASAIGLALSLDYAHRYRRLLRSSALAWLARYSYGIYVFHILLKVLVLPSAERWGSLLGSRLLGGLLFMSAGVGSSLAVAFASYHLYEKHFLKLKRAFPD